MMIRKIHNIRTDHKILGLTLLYMYMYNGNEKPQTLFTTVSDLTPAAQKLFCISCK